MVNHPVYNIAQQLTWKKLPIGLVMKQNVAVCLATLEFKM